MKNRIITTGGFLFICLLSMVITGCNLFSSNKKTETEVSKVKENMMEKLNNYSMNAKIVSGTPVGDVTITVGCIEDNKNKIEYCKTSTLGIIDIEEYIDYKNNKVYTRTEQLVGGDENDGKWISKKLDKDTKSQVTNWMGLNDYLKELNITEQNGGKLYSGKIDIKKVQSAISDSDAKSKINIPSLTSKDIPIEVFINSAGYIETTKTEFEILGIKENVNIQYSNFNKNNDLSIPKEAL